MNTRHHHPAAEDGVSEHRTFCRLCTGRCGLVVTTDRTGRLVDARGDKDHLMSEGYACIKGLQAPAIHNDPARLLHPLKRRDDGRFVEIPLEQALDEIAARLAAIIEQSGPQAVALFRGTANYFNGAASYMVRPFMDALGSHQFFSTMTIDQSAKWVTEERLGSWDAGRHRIEDADVFMAFGYNPLLSVQGGYGFTVNNPSLTMRALKRRGMKLIVIDPRRTETALHADLHLQPLPGEDATIAAGMLALILSEGWHDRDFCARWVPELEDLRRAVAPFTPSFVAAKAGIDEEMFREAVRIFAHESQRGIAMTGTGPDMASHSNVANHLIECLNVICGRFNREGDQIANPGVLEPRRRWRAQARSPRRRFESTPKGRVRGLGQLYGEMMSPTLPEEILTPGDGRIRVLFNVGGNPASALPDQRKSVEALSSLDLLVSLDPSMSNTAKLSHYIIPPKLMLERPDAPTIWETASYPLPFAQYTPAVAQPPEASEVVDEWYVFWALAKRLGRQIIYCGEALDMETPPGTEDLLDLITRNAQLPLAEVRKRPGGVVYRGEPQAVAPPDPDAKGAFAVAPPDALAEISALLEEHDEVSADYPFRLAVRRTREVLNSSYRDVPAIRDRVPYNPAALHPDDLAAIGLAAGDRAEIVSEHGSVPAIVKVDPSLRRGVVTMSHNFGGLPGEALPYEQAGANTNLLVSLDRAVQSINGMARMSAIPVRVRAARAS